MPEWVICAATLRQLVVVPGVRCCVERSWGLLAAGRGPGWWGMPEYVLDHHQEGGRERLALMSRLLDPMHRGQIERLGVGSGARTLEVGCGNGSVSAWLAGRIAPGGRAVAVDLDLSLAIADVPGLELRQADENTRAVYCESVGNPAGNVADIEGLAKVAHKHGVPLVVDNTVATPILLRPIEYGADVVVHSMTKFIGGGGTSIGGMIVDGGKFPWRQYPDKFYMFNRPEIAYHGVVYVDHFGDSAFVARCRTVCQRNTGATLSPFNGFLFLQGIQTMALRVERHVANARKVAEFLRDHPMVKWVNYVGFPDNPLYPMAHRYLGDNFCSLLTFGVKGGYEGGRKCFNAFRLFKRMVNMGDAKSLSCHPASTTHRQLTPEEQAKVGVTPEMIRLSVGIEHIDDILDDLGQALEKAAK